MRWIPAAITCGKAFVSNTSPVVKPWFATPDAAQHAQERCIYVTDTLQLGHRIQDVHVEEKEGEVELDEMHPLGLPSGIRFVV